MKVILTPDDDGNDVGKGGNGDVDDDSGDDVDDDGGGDVDDDAGDDVDDSGGGYVDDDNGDDFDHDGDDVDNGGIDDSLGFIHNEIYVDDDGFGDGDDQEKDDKYDVYNYDYGVDDLRTMWIMVLLAIG